MSEPQTEAPREEKPGKRPIALVTGASAGLGREFAERLAERGFHLILVARREDRLREVLARLTAAHGIQGWTVSCDLAEPGAAETLYRKVAELNQEVDLLVNNAGFGYYGPVVEQPVEEARRLMTINVNSFAELAMRFGGEMARRKRGTLINVSSGAGFVPTPLFGLYGASKAFALSLSQCLSAELEEHGVRVLCVCPGATATEFHQTAAGDPAARDHAIPQVMQARDVVAESMRALDAGKWVVVPGFANKVQAQLPRRLLPGRVVVRAVMSKMRQRISLLRPA